MYVWNIWGYNLFKYQVKTLSWYLLAQMVFEYWASKGSFRASSVNHRLLKTVILGIRKNLLSHRVKEQSSHLKNIQQSFPELHLPKICRTICWTSVQGRVGNLFLFTTSVYLIHCNREENVLANLEYPQTTTVKTVIFCV